VDIYVSAYSHNELSMGMSLDVPMDATRTLAWLKENYDIDPVPIGEIREINDYDSYSKYYSYYWSY
jgi:hypothetical protein